MTDKVYAITDTQLSQLKSASIAGSSAVEGAKSAVITENAQFGLTPLDLEQPYSNPYTDDTHLVFAHSVCAPYNGQAPWSVAGSVEGWVKTFSELMACGVDGVFANLFGLTPDFTTNFLNMLAAAGVLNAAAKLPDGTYASNGQGVTKFRIVAAPDMSCVSESGATLAQFATLLSTWAKDPSYFTFQGQPVVSMYVGDGAGAGQTGAQAVKQVYSAMLAQIKTEGLDALFIPGWNGTNGSSGVDEVLAVGGDGIADLFSATNILSAGSHQLEDIEATAAKVKAAKTAAGKPFLFAHSISPYGYTKIDNSGNLLFYNEFGGSRSRTAQFDSAINVTQPPLILLFTVDDAAEQTAFGSGAANAYLPGHAPLGVFGANIKGFYSQNTGIRYGLAYDIRRYKTGQTPKITKPKLVVHNRKHLAALAKADPSKICGIAGDPPGLLDVVNVDVYADKSCEVRLTGVGPQQLLDCAAGMRQICFYNAQAGIPLVEMLVEGQVVCQCYGQEIAATTTQINFNPESIVSNSGVSFRLAASAAPNNYPVDRAGFIVRSTSISYKSVGLRNFALYDATGPTEKLIAQNTMQDPAALAGTLPQNLLASSKVPGQDPFVQYNGYAYVGLFPNPLDPTESLAYAQYYPNDNAVDIIPKALPAKVRIHCEIVSTGTDGNKDGQGGPALVSSTGNTYMGWGYTFPIQLYGNGWSFSIKAEDNETADQNSKGPNTLALRGLNALAPGEFYYLDVLYDGVEMVAIATPSNQPYPPYGGLA